MRLINNIMDKVYLKKDKRHLIITPALVTEIRNTQDLMRRDIYKKKRKKVRVSILRASDFIASVYRQERLRLQSK